MRRSCRLRPLQPPAAVRFASIRSAASQPGSHHSPPGHSVPEQRPAPHAVKAGRNSLNTWHMEICRSTYYVELFAKKILGSRRLHLYYCRCNCNTSLSEAASHHHTCGRAVEMLHQKTDAAI